MNHLGYSLLMMREKEGWYKEKNSLLFLLNRKTPPPPLPHSKYNITKRNENSIYHMSKTTLLLCQLKISNIRFENPQNLLHIVIVLWPGLGKAPSRRRTSRRWRTTSSSPGSSSTRPSAATARTSFGESSFVAEHI